jgi:hypothetical protein
MSDKPQKLNLDLKLNGFASATTLVETGKSSVKGEDVSLEPYGVFIGQLSK